MRLVISLLVAALALYGLAVGWLAVRQRHLIYPGVADPPRQDRSRPEGAQTTTLHTSDGERLHALWIPPKPGCGVVVTFHGNGSLPEPHATRFGGPPWADAGWGVLAIAYRGYPGSTGSPSEPGLIEDGMTAYRHAASQAPGAPILLHGHSLGAAIAVAVAAQAAHVGLYLEAPFDSMSHAVRLHLPYFPTWLLLLDTYRSDERIKSGQEPVLIVQGDDDAIVPAELARRLAASAGPRATITVIPGDHVSILGARDDEAERFFRERFAMSRETVPAALAR